VSAIEKRAEGQILRLQAQPNERIRFLPAGALVGKPTPLDWLVRGILLKNSMATLIGATGTLKSFAALDMLASIATETPWHDKATKPGAAFYIAGEGGHGIGRRLRAWEIAKQVPLAHAPLYISTGGAPLADTVCAAAVAVEVEKLANQHDISPVVVAVDTLHRNFGPGDENSSADMGVFIANLDRYLREPYGACVLVIHHTGHGDTSRGRGSSSLKAAVDTEIYATRSDRILTLSCSKSKDAEEFEPMSFQICPVDLDWNDDEGNVETSAVLKPTDYAPPLPAKGLGKAQSAALAILDELQSAHRQRLISDGRDPNGARVAVEEWQNRLIAEKVIGSRQHFWGLKTKLHERREIVIDGLYVSLAA
jgi:hypothetical protein